MRALDSEPERRYESAAQLADDLRRHLDHEPLRADPSTVGYRASKWLRRHRQMVGAALVVFVALTVALTFSIYESRLAAARLQQVRSLASRLVFDVHDAVRLCGATNARQIIVRPAWTTSMPRARRCVGMRAPSSSSPGRIDGSETCKATWPRPTWAIPKAPWPGIGAPSALNDAVRLDGKDLKAEAERLLVYSRIGTVQSVTGQLHDAVQTFAQGVALAGSSPSSDADVRAAQAALYVGSSDAKRNMSDYNGALADATESLRLGREALAARPSDPQLTRAVATEYASVGMAQSHLDRLADARANFEHGAEEIETLVAADPQNVSLNRDLMLAYGHVADILGNPALQNLGDRPGALRMYQRAAAIGKRLFDADHADERAVTDYGIVLSRVETAMGNEDLPAKIAVQRESRQVLEQAARIGPKDVSVPIYRSLVAQHLGDAFSASGDRRSALSAYLESASIAESSLGLGNSSSLILFVQSTRNVALASVGLGRRSEALTAARRALEVAEHPPAGASSSLRVVPRGLSAMGLTYAALFISRLREPNDRQQALLWLRKSLNAWQASQSEPGFGAPHRLEMHDVEDALARVGRPVSIMPPPTNAPLTPSQRARVRETLEAVAHQIEPVALLFYGRLFELDPSARRLFHIDLAVQSRKIMDTLVSIAKSLEQFDLLSERLADLGRKHASYGVRPDQYESVTNALMWALAQALGPDRSANARGLGVDARACVRGHAAGSVESLLNVTARRAAAWASRTADSLAESRI